jgi:hypothetical protein
MVGDVETTPVKPKKRRRKDLYFTSEKKRFKLSVEKKMQTKKGKETC